MVLAKLIQAAGIAETDHVLDVGCATGYSTALLARLAGSVVGLEEDRTLARQAAATLTAAGAPNAQLGTGALFGRGPAEDPYGPILPGRASQVSPAAVLEV